jgi:crotonobetainyl-CoA:carnitine CoA-transferase CaiB-like acyl-CoA transferase
MDDLPLKGINVLDLSRVLAGPLCTMMLGDFGANVIKVERPGSGDDTRGWGPPFADDGQSAYFRSVNRNKLSVTLDLKLAADAAVVLRLISEADVVIDNFMTGALEHYGLHKAELLAWYPKLIWCTISGFGPKSQRPGYDYVVQAESGWMAVTGPVEGPPTKTGVAFADIIAGKDAATSILAALVGRDRGLAVERSIHVALAQSATAALANVAQNTLVSGQEAKRWGNAHPNLVPYQLFATSDRDMVLAVGTDAQWPLAARALGLEELAAEPAFATNAGRLANRDQIVLAISNQLLTQPATFWIDRLSKSGIPCGVVRTVSEALADVPDASKETGVPPIATGRVRFNPPHLNEHGKEICAKYWSAFD